MCRGYPSKKYSVFSVQYSIFVCLLLCLASILILNLNPLGIQHFGLLSSFVIENPHSSTSAPPVSPADFAARHPLPGRERCLRKGCGVLRARWQSCRAAA